VRTPAPLASPASYRGENTVFLVPHLDGADSREVSARIGDWCDFFERGSSEILDLTIRGRTSQRLFDALATQTQLRRLDISQGPFDDLTRLDGMRELVDLTLDSATSISSLDPLARHTQLRSLHLHNAKRIHDYSAIGGLVRLKQLSIWGGRADSIEFVRSLKSLKYLSWHLVPPNLDYSALLDLVWVEDMSVRTQRGSVPSHLDLEWALPGMQRRAADRARGISYAWRLGERIGDYRETPDGQRGLFRYETEEFDPWRF
jgi:hypothetical protein